MSELKIKIAIVPKKITQMANSISKIFSADRKTVSHRKQILYQHLAIPQSNVLQLPLPKNVNTLRTRRQTVSHIPPKRSSRLSFLPPVFA